MFGIGSGVKKAAAKEADAIVPARTAAQKELYSELESRLERAQSNLEHYQKSAVSSAEEVDALTRALTALQNAP